MRVCDLHRRMSIGGWPVATRVASKAATRRVPIEEDLCCSSVTEAPLAEAEAAELAAVLAALADPVRLRLFSLVAAQGEVCSCDLEGPLARSQPTVSHHTRILADAG